MTIHSRTHYSLQQLQKWSVEIRDQESAVDDTRCNTFNPENLVEASRTVKATSLFDHVIELLNLAPSTQCTPPPLELLSPAAVIQQIGEQY
jgi:hypothetical protein